MTRIFGIFLSFGVLFLVVHALAQDQVPDDFDLLKKKPTPKVDDTLQKPMTIDPKKADGTEPDLGKLPEIEPLEPVEPMKQEDPQVVLERIKKNMTAAQERLDRKDVGDRTREIQHDIVRDLDALINRAEESQSGGKSKPSLGGGKSGQGGSQSTARKKSGSKQSGSSSSSGQSQQAKADNQGKQASGGKDKADGKKDELASGKKNGEGEAKDGQGNGGRGGNSPEKKETNTVADLFQEVWGHLPAARRMEMDAYSRERFMARYEDLLREYYRTIAERSRRGGN